MLDPNFQALAHAEVLLPVPHLTVLKPSALRRPVSPLQNWQGCFYFFSLKAECIIKHLSLL